MKDDLSQKKNTQKYDIFSKKKMDFSKRDMIFPELSKKVVFFPKNMVIFPWTENERKMNFLKKYSETWYFVFDMFHALRSCIWRCAWAPTEEIICPLGDGLYFQKYKNGSKNFLAQG